MSWKLVLALVAGAAGGAALARDRHHDGELEGVPEWWTKQHPREKWRRVCYTTKTDALKVFADYNHRIIDEWGGINAKGSKGEFDAINHKNGLSGRRAAKTIGEALWLAMPAGRPFCLDRIDLEALNGTSPAREHPVGFQLPDYVEDELMRRQEELHYREHRS